MQKETFNLIALAVALFSALAAIGISVIPAIIQKRKTKRFSKKIINLSLNMMHKQLENFLKYNAKTTKVEGIDHFCYTPEIKEINTLIDINKQIELLIKYADLQNNREIIKLNEIIDISLFVFSGWPVNSEKWNILKKKINEYLK